LQALFVHCNKSVIAAARHSSESWNLSALVDLCR